MRIFIQALVLGVAVGLCLAGGLGLLYGALHPAQWPGPRGPILYFYLAGGVMGLLTGWAFALQRVLDHLLALLFKTVAQLIPMTAGALGTEWTAKVQVFFQEVLKPFPPFFQWIMTRFFISRFKNPGRLNKALGKAQKQQHLGSLTPEWMVGVALHYFLEPLTAAFFVVYVILFILTAVFWAMPFIG